jgi:hypothetical protein
MNEFLMQNSLALAILAAVIVGIFLNQAGNALFDPGASHWLTEDRFDQKMTLLEFKLAQRIQDMRAPADDEDEDDEDEDDEDSDTVDESAELANLLQARLRARNADVTVQPDVVVTPPYPDELRLRVNRHDEQLRATDVNLTRLVAQHQRLDVEVHDLQKKLEELQRAVDGSPEDIQARWEAERQRYAIELVTIRNELAAMAGRRPVS